MESRCFPMLAVCLIAGLMMTVEAADDSHNHNNTHSDHNNSHGDQGYSTHGCPCGWTRFASRCYVYMSTPMTWVNAEKKCLYEGGNLASIHNQEENDFLVVLIKGQTCGKMNRTWIGGDDTVQEDFFQWSDGSKFLYTNWAPGEPDHQGPEHCINLKGDMWDELDCSKQLPFLCSVRINY